MSTQSSDSRPKLSEKELLTPDKFVMKRIVVGISGATGAPLAVRVLEFLRDLDVEVHLVVSQWARATLLLECGIRAKDLTK